MEEKMNKEILFRAKRIDNGEWVEGNYITNERDEEKAYIGYLFDVRNGAVHDFDIVEVIPKTICEYTGITDKNDQKIFEGDIVQDLDIESVGKVVWYEGDYIGFAVDEIYNSVQQYDKEMFDEVEVIGNIFDNPGMLMNIERKEEKQLVFEPLLKDFETETIAEYFRDMVAEIPDYIFTIPSSTSGKYHNATQCKKYGQIYHSYMFASILNHRLRLKANREKYNTPEIRDCMRCVSVFHDAVKCGWNGEEYTVQEHPILAAEWVRDTHVDHDIPDEYKEMIACMCEAHSGEWNKNQSGEVLMPEPRNDMEFFIHECDILSSRADLDMRIPAELKDILKDFLLDG